MVKFGYRKFMLQQCEDKLEGGISQDIGIMVQVIDKVIRFRQGYGYGDVDILEFRVICCEIKDR